MLSDASNLPDEWLTGLDALRQMPDGGAALLIGAMDRGKTTFAARAARILAADFARVAVVDADIGQSEIGPPGTIGVARADANAERLSDLKPAGIYFVGSYSPATALTEMVTATAQAIHRARSAAAHRIIVDTSGFVSGPNARRLKVAKAQVIAPTLILGFGAEDENALLLAALTAATGAKLLILPTAPAVGRKPAALRATRRLTRVARALENAREMDLPLRDISIVGSLLGIGEPLPPELVRWAGSALRMNIVYGERSESVLTLFLNGGAPRRDWENDAGPIASHFKAQSVRVLSLTNFTGAYLGLHDHRGRLMTIARCVGLDAERQSLTVAAPPPAAPERIRLVSFGRVRLNSDGSPHSDIKPGEI